MPDRPNLLLFMPETVRADAVTGRSLHDDIRRVQINRAKRLLAETTLPVHKVAAACAFRPRVRRPAGRRRSLAAG